MTETKIRKVNPVVQNELDKVEKQFDGFESQVKSMTLDKTNEAPIAEVEPQTKLSSREIEKSKQIYLKPVRTISVRDKFNEAYREEYNFAKEYVQFVAENRELKGDKIEIWTRPYGGIPAEYWEVPSNVPVWGPRYLAEQIRRKIYTRFVMAQIPANQDGMGRYYGTMAAETKIARLTCEPVTTRKSIFMGAASF